MFNGRFYPGKKHCLTLALLAALPLLAPAAPQEKKNDPPSGEVTAPSRVTYELIGTYSVERLNKILTSELKEFSSQPADYPAARYPVKLYRVKLYRVIYPSVIPEQSNRPTVASGLIAVPESGSGTMPVVSYQHGTVFSKTEVPSHPDESMETRLMIAQFAGQGYLVVGADYFGKGVSAESDSYLVKGSTQQACLDMLFAARTASAELKLKWGPLFVSGWSQGGWATMLFLAKLESLDIPVRAAATASAPMDMFAIINGWLHAPKESDAVWIPGLIALQLNAYERYYRLPGLAQASIKPQYATAARDLYLNTKSWGEASPGLSKRLGDLLADDVISASSLANSRYWELVKDSEVYRWRNKTPLRVYYGESDEVIPTTIGALPVGFQKVMGGGETTGVEVPKADHRGTFVHAVAEQKKWFDQLLSK